MLLEKKAELPDLLIWKKSKRRDEPSPKATERVLRIVQSALAEQNSVNISVYTDEQWNIEQADNYLNELVAGFERLIEHL